MNRRTLLRAAGVSLALPWLEAMSVCSASVTNAGSMNKNEIPRRVYFSNWAFFEVDRGIPKDTGLNYTLTPTLSSLAPFKKDFTLFSGLRCYAGSHTGHSCTLTGMNSQTNGIKLVSVDQQIAEFYQGKTRAPSLVLATSKNCSNLSWSRNKTPVAHEISPKAVFDRLFLIENPKEREAIQRRMADQKSILDEVRQQARKLQEKLGKDDRETLEQYFTSIREVEERVRIDQEWLNRPKPKVDPLDFGKAPPEKLAMVNDDGTGMRNYLRLMFDIIVLAFRTDSTRVVSHFAKHENVPVFKEKTKIPFDYHNLTHHGNQEDKLNWWAQIDRHYMEFWAYFLGKLKNTPEGNSTLLDHTIAGWATAQGAGGHGQVDLPLMLCGGTAFGLKHQGHLVKKNMRIGSAWETVAQCVGMPIDRKTFQGGQTDGVIKEVL
jgi:hypothetical protein